MGPVRPGNTACVCRAAQALPAGTPSCHHHGGPAAIWPIVLIARHLRLAEIALGLFWCPILPVVVAADDHLPGRGRLPPARVTTIPPPPQRSCHSDATPREWLQPIIGDHDEIGTPSWAKSMLLWVIIFITALSLLRLGTWQGRIGISAIAIVAVASLAPPGCQPTTPGTQGEIAINLAALV